MFDEGELQKDAVVKKFLTTAEQAYLDALNKEIKMFFLKLEQQE